MLKFNGPKFRPSTVHFSNLFSIKNGKCNFHDLVGGEGESGEGIHVAHLILLFSHVIIVV